MMRAGILSFALTAIAEKTGSDLHVEGGELSLSYKDCGDSSYHSKIIGLTPNVAPIGRKVKITGTGDLNEDISDATFDMQVAFSSGVPLLDCSGDASRQKKCGFPLRTGSLTFAGVNFPIKAGPQDINLDLYLSPLLPAGFIKTMTKVTAVTGGGEQIFCIKVFTGKSTSANGEVSLTHEDCGDARTHAKITALTPASAQVGRKTRITGKGILDKDVTDGTFHVETFFTGGDLLSCKGDAAQSQKCNLGGILGSLTFDALSFPVKKGDASVSVDMSLNPFIPAALARTTTKVTASTKRGDKIFCMEIFTNPASMNSTAAVIV